MSFVPNINSILKHQSIILLTLTLIPFSSCTDIKDNCYDCNCTNCKLNVHNECFKVTSGLAEGADEKGIASCLLKSWDQKIDKNGTWIRTIARQAGGAESLEECLYNQDTPEYVSME